MLFRCIVITIRPAKMIHVAAAGILWSISSSVLSFFLERVSQKPQWIILEVYNFLLYKNIYIYSIKSIQLMIFYSRENYSIHYGVENSRANSM